MFAKFFIFILFIAAEITLGIYSLAISESLLARFLFFILSMLRHFLNLQDLTIEELREIIAQSILLKKSHKFSKVLEGKYLALIFEKASTRSTAPHKKL